MAETTGQIDKLIEQKVDQKIRDFGKKIGDEISTFLRDNGDYNGSDFYQVKGWQYKNSQYEPTEFMHSKVHLFTKGLMLGLDKSIKDKMISAATKELLDKVSLLS